MSHLQEQLGDMNNHHKMSLFGKDETECNKPELSTNPKRTDPNVKHKKKPSDEKSKTLSITVNTNNLCYMQNLIKNQLIVWVPADMTVKKILLRIIDEMKNDNDTVFSKEFIDSLCLINSGETLDLTAKLSSINIRSGANGYWFDLRLKIGLSPLCIQVQHSSKKFVFVDSEICSSVIKQIKKHINIGQIVRYKRPDDNVIELTNIENINKKLELIGFDKYYANDRNVLTHEKIERKQRKIDFEAMDIDTTNSLDTTTLHVAKRKKTISATKKTDVWNTYVGESMGKALCFCCRKKEITSRNFHVGHITSERDGGTLDIDNLRPICVQCNLSMGAHNMAIFMVDNGYGELV